MRRDEMRFASGMSKSDLILSDSDAGPTYCLMW